MKVTVHDHVIVGASRADDTARAPVTRRGSAAKMPTPTAALVGVLKDR